MYFELDRFDVLHPCLLTALLQWWKMRKPGFLCMCMGLEWLEMYNP